MNGRSSRRVVLAASLAVTGATAALAQDAPANAPPAPPAPAAPAPAAGAPGAAAAPAPAAPAGSAAAAASSAPAPPGNVTGYAYSTKPRSEPAAPSAPARHYPRMHHHPDEAVATLPGFEMLADGGSRLFVQLSKQVDVDQQKEAGRPAPVPRKGKRARAVAASGPTLTFTLKGTEVLRRNNELALVTVHFNTPVVRARLLPAGRDLRFVVDLRADVTPQMKIVPAKDNGAMLQIDFPQGSYLPAQGAAPDAAPDSAGDSSESGN